MRLDSYGILSSKPDSSMKEREKGFHQGLNIVGRTTNLARPFVVPAHNIFSMLLIGLRRKSITRQFFRHHHVCTPFLSVLDRNFIYYNFLQRCHFLPIFPHRLKLYLQGFSEYLPLFITIITRKLINRAPLLI